MLTKCLDPSIIAQVKQALKDAQITDEVIVVNFDEEYIGMKQTELIPVLTKVIQEQQTQIKDLQSQIDELKDILNKVLKAKKQNLNIFWVKNHLTHIPLLSYRCFLKKVFH